MAEPVETKVTAATAAAYVTSTGLLAALAVVQNDVRLVGWMPDAVAPFVLAVVPTLMTFAAGWKARHTPRLGAR
ncbi:holin [Streptomyces phaeochromogenes]|uniref:holin n=1 Tax=Streptomyces phaeochromogenes TaxID=1923 RepID=UPI00225624F4|nr:holin [Streptomyces phaeochromogenes]MCX5601638.1 holin [Streptomyces phaeochromogenes]